MLENYLTPTQLGEKLGISRQGVHKMMRKGRIHFERIGNRYFIPKGAKIRPARAAAGLTQKSVKVHRTPS